MHFKTMKLSPVCSSNQPNLKKKISENTSKFESLHLDPQKNHFYITPPPVARSHIFSDLREFLVSCLLIKTSEF